ncbi:VOC family protein [Kineococcus rubinsiae]|uniref:VOC family protein n=1 Tax=Kineococcus rubinsiae TaxID=2609562 RepID=UPI001431FB9A|nr:VOC family protein [Kineococcus rubinsiae]NIZ90454.1 VOC family protein [Kineococcus rubinsiae]
MTFRHLLAQAVVRDLRVAEPWYAEVFAGPPGARPMDGLLEWELGESFGVQVWCDPARAGRSTLVLEVSDLDALAARLTAAGLPHDGPQPITVGRALVLTDPDGNRVVVTGP